MNTLHMRPSRVLRLLRAGRTVFCTKMNLADSRVAELAAMSGFDCIWTDMEHVANDWSSVERQIMAAKVYDVDTIVRVERGSYSDYVRPLEMDASGIMVPHIMSAADARDVIRNTKFHPIGLRPADGGNADGRYCQLPFREYLQAANDQRLVILQIEDPEPLRELDEIAALPGVGMLFFGPGDFSQAIGEPGRLDHPRIQAARRQVAEAAARAGIYAGTVAKPETARELVKLGYRFLNIGADVAGLGAYYRGLHQQLSLQCT